MRRIAFCFPAFRGLGVSAALAGGMILCAASTTPTSAQTAPTAPPTQPRAANAEQMAQQRLADLHQRLRITPAQEGAWDRFAQASTQNAAQLDNAFRNRASQTDSMNAVQNMQSFAELDMRRAQDMQQLVAPFQQLYAALSPEQQRAVDEMFRNRSERATSRHTAR